MGMLKLLAHRLEQVAQAELLGRHLDIDVEVVPQADRQVFLVGVVDELIDQALDFVGNVAGVDLLQTNSLTRGILGADVERQSADGGDSPALASTLA